MSNNKNLKIGDTLYIDILDTDNYMSTTLPNNKCLKEKITKITDKYIQTETNLYNLKTNEQILSENDDYTTFFKKFYQSKEDLFAERERFKKYKIFYETIKNETEYASFLNKLPEKTLDEIIKQIQSTQK